jgi:hypothetical protein
MAGVMAPVTWITLLQRGRNHMAPRLLLRTAGPLAAAALILGLGLTSAQASPAPGWRIVQVFPASAAGPTSLGGVAATGESDAWLAGNTASGLFVEHWNGGSWTQVAAPAGFTDTASRTVNAGPVAAASASDVWTFPTVSTSSVTTFYALHRADGTWQQFRLTGLTGMFSGAVFSSSNAWAFGQAPTRNQGLGFGAPYAARYNGRAWTRVSMPGTPLNVSPLSASDIWGFGPTAKTAGLTDQVMIAMHWNGKSWSTLAIPKYKISGEQVVVGSMVALSANDLWVAEFPPANPCGCEGMPLGIVLANWNGHRWREVVSDTSDAYQAGLAADGDGGVWLVGFNADSPGVQEFLHYNDGTLTRTPEPTASGYTTGPAAAVLIPGTTSLWAAAELNPTAGGNPAAGLLKYGP